MEHTYIECNCSSHEHTICYTLDDDPDFPAIYVSVQLNKYHNFFGRLWLALKYIFGYECKYGHWDEAELMGEEVSKLYDLCYKHLQQYQQAEYWKGKDNGNDIDNDVD